MLDNALIAAVRALGPKPEEDAEQKDKKRYSERLSAVIAVTIAADLKRRGLTDVRPVGPGEIDAGSGAERRMAGGIGAKKVDITWATPESGLLLGISIKTFNARDRKSGNFQKNLTNRRGDTLMEAVTLHRRFPYGVLGCFFFFDVGAESDDVRKVGTRPNRLSTFRNAHALLRLFTGRNDPEGRDEQFERLYVGLVDSLSEGIVLRAYEAGCPDQAVSFSEIVDQLLYIVAERNSDFYAFDQSTGKISRVSRAAR